MTDRFDKFTERARKTLQLAQEEAQRFNHNYIGTEHILLGLVREGDGVAARVLNNLGIELTKVRSAVEFIIGRGDRMVMGEIGLTPRAKRVIELAVDEARRLNHHYIGTEHLLLGLVREGEGIAAGVLESLGVSLKTVRAQVVGELSSSSEGALRGWVQANLNFHLFGQVDDSFLNTIRDAAPIAGLLRHDCLGTGHLLAVMMRNSESAAFRLLREVGADLAEINTILNKGVGKAWAGKFTYRAMHSIQLAIEEATSSDQLPATSDHLLLGIILEGTGTGAAALLSAGLTAERVRAFILESRAPGGS